MPQRVDVEERKIKDAKWILFLKVYFINELKLVNSCCSGEVGAVCGNTDLLLLLGESVCVCVRTCVEA